MAQTKSKPKVRHARRAAPKKGRKAATARKPAAAPTPAAPPPEAYDRIPRVSLTATDETLWVTRFDERGEPSVTYPVSVADAAAAFRGLAGAGTGLLPDGILFWSKGEHESRLGLWLPPAVHTLTWQSGKHEEVFRVPLPGLVFVGSGSQYSVYAAPVRPQSESAPLFHAPFSNVNDDGAICFGNVQFPRCAPGTIAAAAGLFLDSNFNDHLASHRIANDESIPLPAILRGLQLESEFPAFYLREARLTMGELIKGGRAYLEVDDDLDLEGVLAEGFDEGDEETWYGDGEELRAEIAEQEEMELA